MNKTVRIPDKAVKSLKRAAINKGVSFKQLLEQALADYFNYKL